MISGILGGLLIGVYLGMYVRNLLLVVVLSFIASIFWADICFYGGLP